MPRKNIEDGFSCNEKNNFKNNFKSLGFSYICENEFRLQKFRLSLALAATLIYNIKIKLGKECSISINPTEVSQDFNALKRYFDHSNRVIPVLEKTLKLTSVKSTKHSQLEVIHEKLYMIRSYLVFFGFNSPTATIGNLYAFYLPFKRGNRFIPSFLGT